MPNATTANGAHQIRSQIRVSRSRCPTHSGSVPDSTEISIPSKKGDPCELRGRLMYRIGKGNLSPAAWGPIRPPHMSHLPCCLVPTRCSRIASPQHRWHLLQLDYDATQRALDSDDTRPPVPAPRRPRGLVHPDTQYQQPSSTTSFISMYSSVDAFHTPCRYHLLLHAADSSSREITGSRSVAFIPTINHQECLQASIVFRLWFLPVAHDNEFFPPSPCARDLIAAICQSNPVAPP